MRLTSGRLVRVHRKGVWLPSETPRRNRCRCMPPALASFFSSPTSGLVCDKAHDRLTHDLNRLKAPRVYVAVKHQAQRIQWMAQRACWVEERRVKAYWPPGRVTRPRRGHRDAPVALGTGDAEGALPRNAGKRWAAVGASATLQQTGAPVLDAYCTPVTIVTIKHTSLIGMSDPQLNRSVAPHACPGEARLYLQCSHW